MGGLVSHETPKARKDHCCDGREQISRFLTWDDVNDEIPDVKDCGGDIKKGDIYIRQFIVGDYAYTWKSCKTCYEIIEKLKLYENE